MSDSLHHHLQERVKELTALHGTARLLQTPGQPLDAVMAGVVALLPPAWQYPDIASGRIVLGDRQWTTPNHADSPWVQREGFWLRDGTVGSLEVAYRRECAPADEGPFLAEERDLIRSLAEMLRSYCQHHQDDAAILEANERLERKVAQRTAALRRLASEMCLVEARERRAIAEGLHDHLGQGLAFVRARLRQLQGDAVFGGHDDQVGELLALVDQAIRYTRDLTFDVSPPVLYELGLGPALDWLGERVRSDHGLRVSVDDRSSHGLPEELRVLLFRSARELLHNVVKHAAARSVAIRLAAVGADVELTVQDDGRGCDAATVTAPGAGRGFGLFSIEERLRLLGGRLELTSRPGAGTRVRLIAPVAREVQV